MKEIGQGNGAGAASGAARSEQAAADAATQAHFTARAAAYAGAGDASLQAMIELAGIRPGERILDVATGTGSALFTLAEQAGRRGLAVGVDFTPAMLAQAALVVAHASRLPFRDGCFDLVACRFAVHHFSDPLGSLVAMAATLRPGGRLVIADFVRPDDPQEAARHDRLERLRGHQHVEIFERARLEALLAGAGCPVRAVRWSTRELRPQDWLSSPNVAPESRQELAQLIEELSAGGGAGMQVRRSSGETRLVRSDVVLLGEKPA